MLRPPCEKQGTLSPEYSYLWYSSLSGAVAVAEDVGYAYSW
jgi:hypothetical protein